MSPGNRQSVDMETNSTERLVRNTVAAIVAGLTLLAWVNLASAQPAARRAAARSRVRTHRADVVRGRRVHSYRVNPRLRPAVRYGRHDHGRRYWHPRYVAPLPPVIVQQSGYPYYVSTTRPPASTTVKITAPATRTRVGSAGDIQERFEQIQQLTALVTEWRTLNESPEFVSRLTRLAGTRSKTAQEQLAKVRKLNTTFDTNTRQAMVNLAAARSAATQIAAAEKALEELTGLADKLPAAR